ncbi:MAG: hypothetical protein ABFS28_04505 [Bacteroidota bacterium]
MARLKLKLPLLTLCLFLSCLSHMHAQEMSNRDSALDLKRNAVYGSVGFGIMSFSGSVYMERIIGKGIESWGEAFIRVGIIGIKGLSLGNVLAIDGGLLISGLSRSRYGLLEIAAGWHPLLDGETGFPPLGGTFAYRYQKPQGNFIFRFGAGIPEILFIGIGFCF